MLHRYSGLEDVAIGTVSSGRKLSELEVDAAPRAKGVLANGPRCWRTPEVLSPGDPMHPRPAQSRVAFKLLMLILVPLHASRAAGQETFWVIPHTHWEGAVFKTREEYLQMACRTS